MSEETQFVGGRPDAAPNPLRRLIVPALAALGIVLAMTMVFLFREPLIGFARSGLDLAAPETAQGEPASTHTFITAALRGDGPSMRQQVTPSCIADPNAALCFDSSSDASWRAYVSNHQIRAVYIGRSGPYVFYLLYIHNPKTGAEHDFSITLHLNPQGLIDVQVGTQF